MTDERTLHGLILAGIELRATHTDSRQIAAANLTAELGGLTLPVVLWYGPGRELLSITQLPVIREENDIWPAATEDMRAVLFADMTRLRQKV